MFHGLRFETVAGARLVLEDQVLLIFAVRGFIMVCQPTMEPLRDSEEGTPSQAEIDEESRRIRRLRILVHLTLQEIAAGDLSAEEAAGMIAATRRAALEMFPGKESAFDLIYKPQFQRMMNAVYRLQ
jgi:hypothetical protein